MKRKILIVAALVTLILVLDQLIKVNIKTHFEPNETYPLLGNWFVLDYIENPGMAFGTQFGTKWWHKLSLSVFRIIAIGTIVYYLFKQAKKGVRTEFLIAVGFILAGATGNLIDSMFYDFIFPYDPCAPFNQMEGSGVTSECWWGTTETRHTGFLYGNVVDMFKFHAYWPKWVPWLGGNEVFPAIWNLADASITVGVAMVFIRQKVYFPKNK